MNAKFNSLWMPGALSTKEPQSMDYLQAQFAHSPMSKIKKIIIHAVAVRFLPTFDSKQRLKAYSAITFIT